MEYITFHLESVFKQNAAKALKFYITNRPKNPNRVPIQQFFMQVEQLNNNLKTLPGLYESQKENLATKPVNPLKDADLATHLL